RVRTRVTDSTPRIIRFVRAQIAQLADESCEATVEIEHRGVGVFAATARGPQGQQDELRAVARATSDALSDAFEAKGARVRVVSVHLVESLTQTVVLVVLAVSRGADSQSLLGVCDAKSDPVRAAALAVLNATNRFLGLLGSQAE
ncbi:MAG: hypothetical protein OEW06_11835, partial [Gemmatimonadota bacterium]|nr:hypothetical protein [Gemmatimonadota bacterium]